MLAFFQAELVMAIRLHLLIGHLKVNGVKRVGSLGLASALPPVFAFLDAGRRILLSHHFS